MLPQHPEWTQVVVQIIEPHTAGLPQDENVVWVSLRVTQIMNAAKKAGHKISRYFIRKIIDSLGLRERSFYKDLPMKEVKDRDEQFQRIAAIRKEAETVGLPTISIDTKKKEMLGNFKREGKALSNGPLKSLDHDFTTFSDGQIVPHGIYDVTKKGLKVHVHINSKTYDIQRPIEETYQNRLAKQVVFAPELGKWNYLVKPVN